MPEKHVESPETVERRDSLKQQERNREHDRKYQERVAREAQEGTNVPPAEKKEDRKPFEKEEQRRKGFEEQRGIKPIEGETEKKVVETPKKPPEILPNVQQQIYGLQQEMLALKQQGQEGDSLSFGKWIPGGGVTGLDYDYLFVGTTKVTPPAKTTNFLQITLGASPSAAWVAAMPETEGSNTVTVDVTKNRIYLSGEFAG